MRILGFDIKRADTPADLLAREQARKIEARSKTITEQGWSVESYLASSGVRVTEEGAMGLAAVYACVRVLSESVASLPLKLYRRDGRARHPAIDHPIYSLLHDQSNEVMTSMQLREIMMVHLALWGNCYLEKEFDNRGYIRGLWPISPARVTPRIVNRGEGVAMEYDVISRESGMRRLRSNQVVHVRGIGFDGIVGKSPIQLHKEGLGISMAAEGYGARFFRNDARPGVVVKHPGTLSDNAFDRLYQSFNDRHQGFKNAYRVQVLEEGMDVATIGLPPGDAQFIETRKYQRSEIASIFRVPPHLIGDLERATYSNIEHQGIEFVVHTLRPWLVRIEQQISMSLLLPEERGEYFAQHVVDGLLRGDIQARYQAYATGRQWGWMSADDVRELEDLNPLPDGKGDVYLQPLNMVPAGSLDSADDVRSESRGVEVRRSTPPRFRIAKSFEPVYIDAFKRIVKREVSETRRALTTYVEAGDTAGFNEWLDRFFDDHSRWIFPRVEPVFRAMAEAMVDAARDELGGEVSVEDIDDFIRDYADAYANRHAGKSRGQLRALLSEDDPLAEIDNRLAEWSSTRADKEAQRERQRSSNAMTKAAWAALGVSVVTWRTVGENCPICEEMDGRSAAISGAFLREGDTVADLTVGSPIGHPPLHKGCDCVLEATFTRGTRRTGTELRGIFDAIIEGGGMIDHNHDHHED